MPYFPMFIELTGKNCLIVGGGKVALRKIRVLQEFEANITVVALDFIEEIRAMSASFKEKLGVQEAAWQGETQVSGEVTLCQKAFEETDLERMELVIAATDEKELNHSISKRCQERGIPCNAVDQIEDCSFIFPAYVKEGEVVAAFSSGGQSPVITQYLKKEIKPVLTENLGKIAECLGALRQEVKENVATEAERKHCYEELLKLGLEKEEVPTENEIAAILKKYQK